MRYLLFFAIFYILTQYCGAQATLRVTDKSVIVKPIPNQNQVASPQKGSVIYNNKTNNPNYYDGKNWRELEGAAIISATDSVTYKINLSSSVYTFSATEKPLTSIIFNSEKAVSFSSGGGTTFGRPTTPDLICTKIFDTNTIYFKRAYWAGAIFPTVDFFMYKQGASSAYFRITLTNVVLTNQKMVNSNQSVFDETIGFNYERIRFTDIAQNKFTEYNVVTYAITNN